MTVWVVLVDPEYEEHSSVSVVAVFDSEEKASAEATLHEEYVWVEKWLVR